MKCIMQRDDDDSCGSWKAVKLTLLRDAMSGSTNSNEERERNVCKVEARLGVVVRGERSARCSMSMMVYMGQEYRSEAAAGNQCSTTAQSEG